MFLKPKKKEMLPSQLMYLGDGERFMVTDPDRAVVEHEGGPDYARLGITNFGPPCNPGKVAYNRSKKHLKVVIASFYLRQKKKIYSTPRSE